SYSMHVLLFFLQAEDGIRDRNVTVVQTCALPICDEDTDNIHSLYVDQWDWEKIISREERNMETLEYTVRKVYSALKDTENYISKIGERRVGKECRSRWSTAECKKRSRVGE